MERRACDGKIGVDNLARNSAHDVNAELESLRVNPISERLESCAIGCRGIAGGIGNEETTAVEKILLLLERMAGGIAHIPAFVDDDVFPSILLERREDRGIGLELVLIDG